MRREKAYNRGSTLESVGDVRLQGRPSPLDSNPRLRRGEDSPKRLAGVTASGDKMAKIRAPLPFYPWYITRYRAHRKAQSMSYVERGLYRELLDECWEEGAIPDDIGKLAEIARCPAGVMAEAWPNIRPCFTPCEGLDGMFLESPRLEQIRTEQDAFRLKQAERARGSHGKPRQATAGHYSKEEKRKEEEGNGPLVTQAAELPTPTTRPPRKAEDWRKLLERPEDRK